MHFRVFSNHIIQLKSGEGREWRKDEKKIFKSTIIDAISFIFSQFS